MAPNEFLARKPPLHGQVVHGPRASDGIGDALRRTFGHAVELPPAWLACLAAIDRGGRH